jgi:FLVCR family MFS transporter
MCHQSPPKATWVRWWVLGVFAVIAGMQGLCWAMPGAIALSSRIAFGWTADQSSLLVNWGPIAFIPLSLPFAWLTGACSLRGMAFLVGTLVLAQGCEYW